MFARRVRREFRHDVLRSPRLRYGGLVCKRTIVVLVFAVLVGPACGADDFEPAPVDRLETTVPATLGVFGFNPNFVARMPGEAAFVAYRGEGDVWRELSGSNGTYDFEIEHPRYTLWVQCPRWFEAPGVIRVLHLGAQDTDRPVVECAVDEPDRVLAIVAVAIGDTPDNRGFVVAMGGSQTRQILATGAIFEARFYGPAEGFDVDRLSVLAEFEGEARELRVERDLHIAGQFVVDADFTGHVPCTNAQIPEVGDWSGVATRYISGQHTSIELRRSILPLNGSDAATVTIAPEEVRDADDIHLVHSFDRQTRRLSFRADPRDASFAPVSQVAQPDLRGLDARGLQFDVPGFDGQVVKLTLTSSSSSPLTVLATATWLDGAETIPTPVPPSFDPSWRYGGAGDEFELFVEAVDGNRTVRELLEDYLFHPRAGPPRRWDGFDVTGSLHLRRGLLP